MNEMQRRTRALRRGAVGVVVVASFAATIAGLACRSGGTSPAPMAVEPPVADGGVAAVDAATTPRARRDDEASTGELVAFRDDADIAAFRARWLADQDEKASRRAKPRPPHAVHPMPGPRGLDGGAAPVVSVAPSPTAAPATKQEAARSRAESRSSAQQSESITNNQHADVDEGDIVKLHKDHLVVLRRGRLFTISLAGGHMKTSRVHDAFGPDIDPRGSWYDEMVVEDDHVVVVGFSYMRGGTEIGLFRIDDAGNLTYRATYHLRSNDYYSARNYASRIVDGRLVFYAPIYVTPNERDIGSRLPAVRRWAKGAKPDAFVRTLAPTKLYHLRDELPASHVTAIHTVTSCDLRTPELTCESIGLVGPAGRTFYVSPSHVYVWMQDWGYSRSPELAEAPPSGLLAKLPIRRGESPVTAVRVRGMPTDQFSFEEEEDGHLSVLVRAQSNGDAMFASEVTLGDVALLRLPPDLFGTDVPVAARQRYRVLPRPDGPTLENRFVGDWLLYGSGRGYVVDHEGDGKLFAVRYKTTEDASVLTLPQGIDRIEPMGDDAVVVGSRMADLVFTPVELGARARARAGYVRRNAAQGELRSHGFFYKPAVDKKRSGVIGLPIRKPASRGARYLLEGSAAVLYLAHDDLAFSELGTLSASTLGTVNDGCRVSCVDWYGNARPIFAKGRVFALLGYELVEGGIVRGNGKESSSLVERGRLSFAPRGGPPAFD